MRVLVIAVGSRGDSEPFCSLAASLAGRKEISSVELFLQTDAQHLVPTGSGKIHSHELPWTQMDFYKWAGKKREPPQAGAGHPNPRVQFLGMVSDLMGELVLPAYTSVMEVIAKGEKPSVDAIVASHLARQLAMEVAGQLSREKPVPLYLVQLQSLVPTKDFPHYSKEDACIAALLGEDGASASEHFASYVELERCQLEFLSAHRTKLVALGGYQEYDALDFDADMLPILTGRQASNPMLDVFMVNAVSPHIVPAPSDAGPKVINVGGLADSYVPAAFSPPAPLLDFLQRHARPLCFGYGSMPFSEAEKITEAVYEAQRPAILVGASMVAVPEGASNEKAMWLQENVHCVSSIPYPWLLPQCSMMFSHGGAGVVHATLRAGIPAVISPLIGDQFFFARYLEAKGWGVKCTEKLTSLSSEAILASISKAEACQAACQALAVAMSGERGPEALADAIIAHVES